MTSAVQIEVYATSAAASLTCAAEAAARAAAEPELVLGLPTGSTPRQLYAEMVRLHRAEGADWSRVRVFNLDEYWPIDPGSVHSFARFMREQLLEPGGFDPARTFLPSGTVERGAVDRHCAEYEAAIAAAGGIRIQLLGIGVNGHLGFNEPGSSWSTRTRLVELAEVTRRRAAPSFFPDPVPTHGISMGLATVLDAEEIWVLAFGAEKAEAVAAALEGPVGVACPASVLRAHPRVRWVLDEAATARLTRSR